MRTRRSSSRPPLRVEVELEQLVLVRRRHLLEHRIHEVLPVRILAEDDGVPHDLLPAPHQDDRHDEFVDVAVEHQCSSGSAARRTPMPLGLFSRRPWGRGYYPEPVRSCERALMLR